MIDAKITRALEGFGDQLKAFVTEQKANGLDINFVLLVNFAEQPTDTHTLTNLVDPSMKQMVLDVANAFDMAEEPVPQKSKSSMVH